MAEVVESQNLRPIENRSSTILNDVCLLQIVNQLPVIDLCQVVNVSHQFQRISATSFSERYKKFKYPNDLDAQSMSEMKSQMRRVCCKFGHLIKSLKNRHRSSRNPIEIDVIVKYCTGLDEFKFHSFETFDCNSAKPLFASLKTLHFSCTQFHGDANGLFSQCGNLKVLKVRQIPFKCGLAAEIAQKYPKLEELCFRAHRLNVETVFALLQLNPQIKTLEMYDKDIEKTICSAALKMDKLEDLVLSGYAASYKNVIELEKFKYLKSLKHLELYDVTGDFITAIDAMENISLSYFMWCGFPDDMKFLDSVFKLKTLTTVILSEIDSPFDEFLLQIGEQLPQLKNLELVFTDEGEDSFVSIDSVRRFIERSKTLCVLILHTIHTHLFDQQFYDSLLVIVRKRCNEEKRERLLLHFPFYYVEPPTLEMESDILHIEFDSK